MYKEQVIYLYTYIYTLCIYICTLYINIYKVWLKYIWTLFLKWKYEKKQPKFHFFFFLKKSGPIHKNFHKPYCKQSENNENIFSHCSRWATFRTIWCTLWIQDFMLYYLMVWFPSLCISTPACQSTGLLLNYKGKKMYLC